MKKLKFLVSLVVAIGLLIVQVGGTLAAPAEQDVPPISGTVQSVTIETDQSTGIITVVVSVVSAEQAAAEVRITQQAAEKLGLIVFNGDGKPIINSLALGKPVQIELKMVIPDQEENGQPVANELARLFTNIAEWIKGTMGIEWQ